MSRFLPLFLLVACISWVDLGPASSSGRKVTAESRNPGSGRAVVATTQPCISVTWRFVPDSGTPVLSNGALYFRLFVDGHEQPGFDEARVHVSGNIAAQNFTTVIPRDQFFNHTLGATLSVNSAQVIATANPSVNGFAGVPCGGAQ